MTMLPLTRRPGGIQAYKLIIPAGAPAAEPDPQTHEGYEWLYVLNGRLRLVLGEHDLVLAAGRGGRVRHPGPALVRRRRTRDAGRVPQPVRPAGRAGARPRPAEDARPAIAGFGAEVYLRTSGTEPGDHDGTAS